MTSSASIASNLAVLVILIRDAPEAHAEHSAAARVLVAALDRRAVLLHPQTDGLAVDAEPVLRSIPGARELSDILLGHGIGEVELSGMVSGDELLVFARTIAKPRGTYRSLDQLLSQLDVSTRAVVQLGSAGSASAVAVAGDFISGDDLMATLGAEGQEPAFSQVMDFVDIEQRAPGQLGDLLEEIAQQPADAGVADHLNEVVGAVDALAARGDWTEVVRVGAALIDAERRAADTPASRTYSLALRRIFPRWTLEHVAPMVLDPPWRDRAIIVLRRIGAEATDILLQCLASAATMVERKAYYGALQQMTEGVPLLINMMTHGEWFVVRNAADLAGDLHLEEAVPQLARQIQHSDERVRRSVVNALAKIGTAGSIEPLRQALRDSSSAVRLLGARALEGSKFRGLAMTLAVLSEEEPDPEVQREMILALGRIGTPEALQALARAAQPGRRIFGRKPVTLRLTAVEALSLAGAPAQTALQGLLSDDDTEIRAAARKALAAVAG